MAKFKDVKANELFAVGERVFWKVEDGSGVNAENILTGMGHVFSDEQEVSLKHENVHQANAERFLRSENAER